MIKVIVHLVGFLISSMLLYGVMISTFSNVNYHGNSLLDWSNNYFISKGGSSFLRFRDFNPNENHDLMFIGSSRTYRGYDPVLFKDYNINSYNLGSSNQTLSNSYIIAKELLNNENTSTLIVDLYPYALSPVSLESSMDLVTNLPGDLLAYKIQLKEFDLRTTNNFFKRLVTKNQPARFKQNDSIQLGFCKTEELLGNQYLTRIENNEVQSEPITILDEELEYIGLFSKFCKQNEIKLIFVISPTSAFFTKKDRKAFLTKIAPHIKESGAPLLDFSVKLNLNSKTQFYDEGHMNYEGVQIFNKALIEELKSLLK